jgi:ESCRT-II complex subunit VPS36
MNFLAPVPLTNAGRPIFLSEEEVELRTFENMEVYETFEDPKVGEKCSENLFSSCVVLLTNVRLVILVINKATNGRIGWGFNLKAVAFFEDLNKGFFRRSKRIRVQFHPEAAQKPTTSQKKDLEIKFLEGDKEEFLELFQRALERKSWEFIKLQHSTTTSEPANKVTTPQESFSVKNAGIGGIIRRQEQSMQNMDHLTKNALTDLNHLIDKAREVVTTVQRYAQLIQENSSDSKKMASNDESLSQDDTLSETTTQINEKNEMETIMQEIGIISPVTKLSSGRSYHQQLAREICDILLSNQRLLRLGGMITLTDLYCLINKLHGTELVSPSDLLRASEYIENLKLGLKLREFPKTKVKVLQLTSLSGGQKDGKRSENDGNDDTLFISKILQVIQSNEDYLSAGITINEVMKSLNLSFIIVKELLLLAEQKQYVCRDETVEGIRYFINQFDFYVKQVEDGKGNRK